MKKERNSFGMILRIAAIAAVLVLPLWLTGCGRTVVYEGGENYPYRIKEKTNGRLEIRLDGSVSPDYEWQYDLPESVTYNQVDEEGVEYGTTVEEAPVELIQKRQEKKGRIKVVVKPLMQRDSYVLTFVRRRAGSQAPSVSYNSAGLPEEVGVDDITDRISISFSVSANEKGKLYCRVIDINNQEMQGVTYMAQESPYPFYYETQDDLFQVTLTESDDWEYSLENTADATTQEQEQVKKAAIEKVQQEMLKDPAWDFDVSQISDAELAEKIKEVKAEREAYILDENNWGFDPVTGSVWLLGDEDQESAEAAEAETDRQPQQEDSEAQQSDEAENSREDQYDGEPESRWYDDPAYHVTVLDVSNIQATKEARLLFSSVSAGKTHFTAKRAEEDFTVEFDLKVDVNGDITVENVAYTGQSQTASEK